MKELKAAEQLFEALNKVVPTGSKAGVQGVPSLDRLIVTHPHADHIIGIGLLIVSAPLGSSGIGCSRSP